MKKLRAGIIGAGNISGVYAKNLLSMFNDCVELCAITDMSADKARESAEKYGIEAVESPNALLARKDIDAVLNLTPPAAHYAVAKAALEAGKHIYNEKPLCAKLSDGEALVALARNKGVRLSCAPDTFLGAGIETARKLISEGWIGRPVSGTAFFMNHGAEHWHPSPAFFYAPGGGPLFDMAPYYLTALVSLLGPVASVSGNTAKGFDTRTVTSNPPAGSQFGTVIPVTTPTHISAILDFASGAPVSLIMSFDVWAHSLPHIEIYGSEGTLQIGDPNWHNSPLRIKRGRAENWSELPLIAPAGPGREAWLTNDNWRGVGFADMARGIAENKAHRASGEQALHILEIMTRIMESGENGSRLSVSPIANT